MKKSLTLIAITSLCIAVNAQQPVNGGFENWNSTILYEDTPPYLTTAQQSYFMFGMPNVWSVPSPVQGNYAARLQTFSNGTDTVSGGMYYGIPGGNGFIGGGAYNERPDSLVFWANANMMPNDTGVVVVALEFMNNVVGYASAGIVGNTGGFVRYSAAFQYFAAFNPDSIACIISSANLFSGAIGIPGSVFEIDSIRLVNAVGQVPNPNFETWMPYVVNEPDGWTTLNWANIYDGNYSVTQDNTPYMGSYDCRIETTVASFGDTIGYITNGNFSGPNGPGSGMQVMQNPQKITGYYKYIPVANDTALAGAWSYHWDVPGDSAQTLEEQVIWLPAAANWTYFEINLTYNTWPAVDTLNIAFASSNYDGTGGVYLGSQLFLDEIGVSYYPLGIEDINAEPVIVFPNPATRFLNVRLENVAAGEQTFNVYDAQGKLVRSAQINNASQSGFYTMEVEDLPAGNYTWTISGRDDSVSGSFVKE